MKFELIGHCNNTLSIILDSICQKYYNHKRVEIDIIYEYKETCNINDGNYLPGQGQNIVIEEFPIEEWYPKSYSLRLIAHMNVKDRFSTYDRCLEEFDLEYEDFASLMHQGGNRSIYTSKVGKGTYIDVGSVIAPYANVGNFNFINRNVSIGHHTRTGDFCSFNPGCNVGGDCIVGQKTTIGIGATVLDNIIIGENSFIGAGSVVTRNVQPNSVVYGVPAKFIRAKK